MPLQPIEAIMGECEGVLRLGRSSPTFRTHATRKNRDELELLTTAWVTSCSG